MKTIDEEVRELNKVLNDDKIVVLPDETEDDVLWVYIKTNCPLIWKEIKGYPYAEGEQILEQLGVVLCIE